LVEQLDQRQSLSALKGASSVGLSFWFKAQGRSQIALFCAGRALHGTRVSLLRRLHRQRCSENTHAFAVMEENA
jgi:hypothetical protein